MPNLYARATALTNVGGRIDYISSPEKQEHLLAFSDGAADLADGKYWRLLAQECKAANKHAAPGTKMCQGRELIVQLSNALLDRLKPEQIVETVERSFRERYNRPCAVALHWNKDMTNLHMHVVFAERDLLQEPEIKIAPRALFFDEQGKRRYKKGEILDDAGELRPGCRIIKKGEEYERHYFSAVDPAFSDRKWLRDCKTNWVLPLRNGELRGDVTITEYDRSSGKLAQQHVGKVSEVDSPEARRKAARIQQYNEAAREWNRHIDQGHVPPKTIKRIQEEISMAPRRNNILLFYLQRLKDLLAERFQRISAQAQSRPAAPAPERPKPSPVPSFTALIAADAALQERQKAANQAKRAVDGDQGREINYALITLPETLRNTLKEMRQALEHKKDSQEQIARIHPPAAPKGPIITKKRKEIYDAAYEAYRAEMAPLWAVKNQSQEALKTGLDRLMPYLDPEERRKQGYGREAPQISADNITSSDLSYLERTIDFKLQQSKPLGKSVAAELRYRDRKEALDAALVAQEEAQGKFDAALAEIPEEHRPAALKAVEKAREDRENQAAVANLTIQERVIAKGKAGPDR